MPNVKRREALSKKRKTFYSMNDIKFNGGKQLWKREINFLKPFFKCE